MACNLTGITINMGGGIPPYNISLCDQGCESGCNNVASTNYDCVYFTACCGTYGLKIVDASGCTTCSDLIIDNGNLILNSENKLIYYDLKTIINNLKWFE